MFKTIPEWNTTGAKIGNIHLTKNCVIMGSQKNGQQQANTESQKGEKNYALWQTVVVPATSPASVQQSAWI